MKGNPTERHIKRRDFLKLGLATAGIGLLQACSPAAPPATTAPAPTTAKPAAQATAAPTSAPPPAATAAPTKAPAAATKAAGPKRGGTFTLANVAFITEFNVYHPVNGQMPLDHALYNSLAHYDEKLQLQPELAEKWDISADGKTVTLKLREGVKFHSGREFTSDDVKASVGFASTDPQSTMISMYKMIKQVETPSKYVAVFNFDSLYAGLYDLLDMLWIIDKETIADRSKSTVGTGPFKLDKYLPNDRVEMVAFKDYWEQGKPYFDKYVYQVIPDAAALAVSLEAGAVDCISGVSYVDAVRLKTAGGKYVVDMGPPGANIYDIGINITIPPFTDKRVRQAVAWSIDRERFCRTTMQGLSEPTCLMWPKNSWAYFPDLQGKIGYDLDKAKALLAEAKVGPFETELLTSSKRGFGYGELAQLLQADLAKIGINAKMADVDVAIYNTRTLTKFDEQIMAHTYGRANRDPGTLVTGAKAWTNLKQGNWTHWDNAEWDQLRTELNGTLDQEKRKVTARKLQEIALDECFSIPVAYQPLVSVYGSYVKGYTYTMMNEPFVGNVWLDK
ncbi:MAG: ABC transporter substrate-binding protein [Chloroflexota bacterium]